MKSHRAQQRSNIAIYRMIIFEDLPLIIAYNRDKKNSIGCSPNLKQLEEHSSPPPLHGSENLGQVNNYPFRVIARE